MYRLISKLVVYHELGEDSIIKKLAGIIEEFDEGVTPKPQLVTRIYREIKRLLDLSTEFGFDDNLWHNYLAYLIITNENSFSLTSEKVGASEGTVNRFAKGDFKIFKELFDYDFSGIEKDLDIDCFSTVSDYHAIAKKERMYNKNVSEKVRRISRDIETCKDENEIFDIVTTFYKDYGVGMFGLNKAFRIAGEGNDVDFIPINNTEYVTLDDLVGYEIQKKKLTDNTDAFVAGRPANNVLLFGDAGTGKSTCIKAIINKYYDGGLRMIEVYKHQFKSLPEIISRIKNRNYRFIIYMDDLSFEDFEIEYKYLKAVIEGGLEIRPDNVLIYATSNRRNLIKENWSDRDDMENENGLHHSDTVQEKQSLASRFGVTISFSSPLQKDFYRIVKALADKCPEITLSEEELYAEARKWEIAHGGMSGRCARQFVDHLAGNVKASH